MTVVVVVVGVVAVEVVVAFVVVVVVEAVREGRHVLQRKRTQRTFIQKFPSVRRSY